MYRLPQLLCLSIFALCVLGCGADYLDVNDNPNVATRPPIDGLLANVSLNTALNQAAVAGHTNFYVQYLAGVNQGDATDTYQEVTNGGAWSALYGTMTDIYDLIRFAEEDGLPRQAAIGKVLMVMNLGLVVDNWGNAPYSDAFSGETIRPVYDSAEDLYATIFRLLDEAEAELVAATDGPAIGAGKDFIYDGNLEQWSRAASSLRARYLNHLSELDRYDPAAVLAAVNAGFQSNEDDAAVTDFSVRNPWATVAINNSQLLLGGWLSAQFIDALNGTTFGTEDPRLRLITNRDTAGNFVGTVNGAGRGGTGTEAGESYLVEEGAFSRPESQLDIITYPELKFIEAEAALASGNQALASTAFQNGFFASMRRVGVDSTMATTYFMANYSDGQITRDDIFREKYVALFLNPETYVDARRYDFAYTDFTIAENADLPSVPVRVQYPHHRDRS